MKAFGLYFKIYALSSIVLKLTFIFKRYQTKVILMLKMLISKETVQ